MGRRMRGERNATPEGAPERAAPAAGASAGRPRVGRKVPPEVRASEPPPEAPKAREVEVTPQPAPLAKVLPGETQVDEALVDQAVQHINRLYTTRALEMAREIGGYVLATFFDGDAENFRERAGSHATFKELSERDDLQFSKVWLWRAVSVYDQLALLPGDLAEELPYTHHTLLLPLHDEQKKVELAKAAVEQGWSSDQLQEQVAKVRESEKTSKGGRKALLPFVKTLNRLGSTVEGESAFAGLDQADQLSEAEVQRLLGLIEAVRGRLDEVEQALAGERS